MAQSASGRGTGQSPANVTRFLKGIDFPAQKKDLVQLARQNQADREVIDLIQNMEEREYESMADVMKVYGKEPGKQAQQGQQVDQPQSRSKSQIHAGAQKPSPSKHGQQHHK